jgi:O-antigen/teichoic acid export membrane protein
VRLPLPRVAANAIVSRGAIEPLGDAKRTNSEVIRGAFALLSTQPLTWAVSLATVALVPRYLGDDGLGRFAVASTVGVLVGTLGSVGVQSLLTRLIATEPALAATYAWGGVAVVTICSLLVGGLVLSATVVFQLEIDLWLAAIAIVTALVLGVNGVLMATLIGLGRNARFAWSLAAGSIVGTVVGLGTLALGGDAIGYALAFLAAWSGSTAFVWLAGGPRFTISALNPALWRQLVVGGLPFLGWNIAIRVRADIDVVLTGILLHSSVAGWLAAAYRIINITVFIPAAITTPLLPALSRSKSQPDVYRSVLGESLSTVLLLTVPISASIFALAPSIPTLLGWPETFHRSIPLMQLLAFQQTLVGVDMVLATGLVALGLERKWLAVAAAGALFNPMLNLLVIPIAASLTGNGAIGAALVELATELLFLTGAISLTPRHLLGRDNLSSAVRIAVAGVLMLAVTLPLRPYSLIFALGCGGVAYLASAFALGVLGRRQINSVRVALRLA